MIVLGSWQKGEALYRAPLTRAEHSGLCGRVNQSVVHFSGFSWLLRFIFRKKRAFIKKCDIGYEILKFSVSFYENLVEFAR
jgi:hypothetical protein